MSSTISTVTETVSSTATASSTILAVPICYHQWFLGSSPRASFACLGWRAWQLATGLAGESRWFHPQSCLAAKIEAGITFAVVGFGLLLFTVFIVLECSEFWEEEKRERRRAQARGGRDEEAISMQDGYHAYRL